MLGDRFSYRTTGFVLRVHIMFQTNTRAPIDMNRETARQFVIALSVTMTTACIVTQIICMCDPEFAFSKQASDSVVSSLHCSARTDTFITLEWTKPVFPARKYAVLISAVNSDKNDNREIDTDAWTDTLMTVDNLTPGQLYTFAVTSVIDWYDEGERRLSSMSIQAGTMPSSPGPVRKSHVNNERVQIVWHASPGFVDHYIVLLKDCKRNVLERKLATKPFVSLDNPHGNTVYEVEIVAVKDGDRSGPVFEEIHAKESDLKVQNLRDTKQDITSITLEWTRPVYSIAVSYKVHWSPLQSDQYHIREVDTGAVSLVIGGLMPGEVYKVWVTSVVRTPCGEDEFHSDQIKVSTVSNIPGEIDKRKSIIKSTSMDLHWKAPPGKVDTYLIRLDGPSSGPDVFSGGPSVLIENLETNTNYEIQIYAISGSARSEPMIEIIKTKDIQIYWGCMMKALLTGGIAVAGLSLFSPFIAAAGFTAAGIGKGTFAATWMSFYGGTVTAGGLFSLLQSAGVVGLTAAAKAAIIASGMALGCIAEVV